MKNITQKAVCLILIVAVTFISTAFVYAEEAHIHSKNCIYYCELDVIAPTTNELHSHTHIDHEGSENCRFSCEYELNTHCSSECNNVWSSDKLQAYLSAVNNVSSDAEFEEVLSEYYDIPTDQIDLTEIRTWVKTTNSSTINSSCLEKLATATDTDNKAELLSKVSGIPTNEIIQLYEGHNSEAPLQA